MKRPLLLLIVALATAVGPAEPARPAAAADTPYPPGPAELFAAPGQPDPALLRRREAAERALLAGDQAAAQTLALAGQGRVLVLLVEFTGSDQATWQPGDEWDPIGAPVVVPGAAAGDCSGIITAAQTFTYGPTLHNAVPRPPSAQAALQGGTAERAFTLWTPDFNPDFYRNLVFGDGVSLAYTAANGDPVAVDVPQSLRSYYETLSKGAYTITGDVVGWIPLPHSAAFYGADRCPGNRSLQPISGYDADGWFNNRRGRKGVDWGDQRTAVRHAVEWINAHLPGFDWTRFDGDGDGRIDTIVVVAAGVSEANFGASEHAVWEHSWSVDVCADPGPDGMCDTADDIRTGAYIWQGETSGLAMLAHEYAHRLGAVDLYTYGAGEASPGVWSVMADARRHGLPWDAMAAGMDPWHKLGWGWLSPLIVRYDDPPQAVVLSQAGAPTPGSFDALLIRLPDQEELQADGTTQRFPHYYLVEWRNDAGPDHALATGACAVQSWGMLVWYVNGKYVDNEVYDHQADGPSFGPKGRLLLVDAHPQPLRDATSPFAHNAISNVSARCYGVRDAAFGLVDRPPFQVRALPWDPAAFGNPDVVYPGQPAVPAFHDSMGYVAGLELTDLAAREVPPGAAAGPPWSSAAGGPFADDRVDPSTSPVAAAKVWAARAWDAGVVTPSTVPYGIAPASYDGSPLVEWLSETQAWSEGWRWAAGTGHPGDVHGQYGVHLQVVAQAADGSWGKIRVWRSPFEFEGVVSQTANTQPVVHGTTVRVDVHAVNIGGAVEGRLVVAIDPDTEYVEGSATGGATPITADEAAAAGRPAVATRRAAGEVVAVALERPVATAVAVDFGFVVRVRSPRGEVQHQVEIFDRDRPIQVLSSAPLTIADADSYSVSRLERRQASMDSTLNARRPAVAAGSGSVLWLGDDDRLRPVVAFPLEGIPPDAAIDEATLFMHAVEGRGFTGPEDSAIEVRVYALQSPWQEDTVTWRTPWAAAGGDLGPALATARLDGNLVGRWVALNVTAAVEAMVRSGQSHGFALTATGPTALRYGFSSREHWNDSAAYLRVNYRVAP